MPEPDMRFINRSIADNDRLETIWSEFLRNVDAPHLIDIFRDLRIAQEALATQTTPEMMADVNHICAYPMCVAAMKVAVGLAVVRVRAELIERARSGMNGGRPKDDGPDGETEAIG